MQVIPLRPLDEQALEQIIALKLDQVAQRLHDAHGMTLHCTPQVLAHLSGQCTRSQSGARAINTLIEQQLMPGVSRQLLQFMVDDDLPTIMALELDDNNELCCVFSDLVPEEDEAQQTTATRAAV